MTEAKLKFTAPVTLVGGGALDRAMLADARTLGRHLVAADGAADRLMELGQPPDAVVGDMDSIRCRAALPPGCRIIELAEQATTDFEKCLYSVDAPLYLGAGFTGRRVDHSLAVFHAMLRYPEKAVILIGQEEIIALAPARQTLSIAVGTGARVSFFPLLPVTGAASGGLKWQIDGLPMEAGSQIGTSNQSTAETIRFAFDGPGALIMLPRPALAALAEALMASAGPESIRKW